MRKPREHAQAQLRAEDIAEALKMAESDQVKLQARADALVRERVDALVNSTDEAVDRIGSRIAEGPRRAAGGRGCSRADRVGNAVDSGTEDPATVVGVLS